MKFFGIDLGTSKCCVAYAVNSARPNFIPQPAVVEFRVIGPDGTAHQLVSRGKASYSERGEPLRMTGLTMDITERRKAEIKHWIENEQFLCFADANYWMSRYGWICNEAGEIFRFSPRKSQEVFTHVLEPFDEQQVAIELFTMKSRQVGISTLVALLFLQRLFLHCSSKPRQSRASSQARSAWRIRRRFSR